MYYSSIGLLAAIVLLIINRDVLLRRKGVEETEDRRFCRRFLVGVLVYYITDMLWGVLSALGLTAWVFADTEIYFAAMALAVLFWTQYVLSYLKKKSIYGTILIRGVQVFVAAEAVLLVINIFRPVLFWFDGGGTYHTALARDVMLIVQIVMFVLTSMYTLYFAMRSGDAARDRYTAIGAFGLAMAAMLMFQFFYPLLPLYSVGFMLGTCLLHAFVIEDEKEEYRRKLEESLQREQEHRRELSSARKLAYRDPLTGVKSKLAYVEAESEMEERMLAGTVKEFAVAVFDLNDLKLVNDTLGHEMGDRYIQTACGIICRHFKHSPVFRIGGDEFAAILEGSDYRDRVELKRSFDSQMEDHQEIDQVVISMGMTDYIADRDSTFDQVFQRADQNMYRRKRELKEKAAAIRAT